MRIWLSSVVAAAALAIPLPAAAQAADCAWGRAEGVQAVEPVPWTQRWLDLDRAWELGRFGAGVTVAVVDTGVDRRHPQLAPAVLPGRDLAGATDGRVDCTGHGTGVAALIAARRDPAVGFAGVAPQARILPVRVAERLGDDVLPSRVAAGVDWAVARGAKIVVLAFTLPGDSAAVRAAISRAVAAGVLVVASAGSAQRPEEVTAGPPSPAAYPGVLGVSATDAEGVADRATHLGSHVDIAAPGVKIVTAAPARGHTMYTGGDMAAAIVAGTAALVLAARPQSTATALAARLVDTADPAPAGPDSPVYGAGIVSPVRALSEPEAAAALPGAPLRLASPTIPAPGPSTVAARVTAAIGATGIAAVLCAVALRRARRRREGGT